MAHTTDHHSEYLAKAIAALTPQGRERVDQLLEQLSQIVGGHPAVRRFAETREAEADLGRTAVSTGGEPALTQQEVGLLLAGFKTIRDQEPRNDVAGWANAVVALLEDES
jgi:hypothetical protein